MFILLAIIAVGVKEVIGPLPLTQAFYYFSRRDSVGRHMLANTHNLNNVSDFLIVADFEDRISIGSKLLIGTFRPSAK